MVTTIAVAGGTGNMGRTIVDALKGNPKYNTIVLARKESKLDVPVIVVDYDNVESITRVLEENNVHTIISTISVRGPVESAAEIALVNAAVKAGPTKRFMASEFGGLTPEDKSIHLPQHEFRLAVLAELQKTDLEWTRVHNGYFLDYSGLPYIESHMMPLVAVVDIAHKVAAIPGTGNDIVTFTYTKDIARFVVAALDLPKWDNALYCYGDKMSWNEFVKIAEEVRGSKFTVTYDSVEMLQKGEITELPSHPFAYHVAPKHILQMYFSKYELYDTMGLMDIPEEGSLNQKFPEIKPTTAREMLSVWAGK